MPDALPHSLNINDLARAAKDFEKRLAQVKQTCRHEVEPGWYPYSTFANIPVLEKLLTGEHRDLSRMIAGGRVLDIGAGDGDLSYFLESQSVSVDVIDLPSINYNRMTGLYGLKKALQSEVNIQVIDLDTQFKLEGRVYGLTLMLGVLYHLRNPFYVLEELARRSQYCLLSTRIARVSPGGGVRFETLPVAYLVGERETNNDPTNFWIFSEPGLRRLFERTGWDVVNVVTTGCRSDSDPVNADRDERAFCLLRSRETNYTDAFQLGSGWYELENQRWRWTQQSFAVSLDARPGMTRLRFSLYLPEELFRDRRQVGLRAMVNGVQLERCVYEAAGEHTYVAALPSEATFTVEFMVDEPFSIDGDDRELGVLVNFIGRSPFLLTSS